MKANEIKRKHKAAFLIIDMFNTFDFPEGEKLLSQAKALVPRILKLKKRLKKKNVAIVYLNDNFGRWNSNSKEVIDHCCGQECPGKDIAELLKPDKDDYFVLKPRHSGFFSTNLEIFLSDLGVEKLIIAGIAGNICVLFTVNDAHMRDFAIWVPNDCVASNTIKDNTYALDLMGKIMGVKTSRSSSSVAAFLK